MPNKFKSLNKKERKNPSSHHPRWLCESTRAQCSWSQCFTTVIGQDPLFTAYLLTLPKMALQEYRKTIPCPD